MPEDLKKASAVAEEVNNQEEEELEDEEEDSVSQMLYQLEVLMNIANTGLEISGGQTDEMLLNQSQRSKLRKIRRKSLKLAEFVLDQAYEFAFSDDKEDPEED